MSALTCNKRAGWPTAIDYRPPSPITAPPPVQNAPQVIGPNPWAKSDTVASSKTHTANGKAKNPWGSGSADENKKSVPKARKFGTPADARCLRTIKEKTLYGGFTNSCDHSVEVSFCGYHPKPNDWMSGNDCEKQQFAATTVKARGRSADHTNSSELVYFYACKSPQWPVEMKFVPGIGIKSHCSEIYSPE
jgi:hypothetical protein